MKTVNNKQVKVKIKVENPRLSPFPGDSQDAIARELYGYVDWQDCDLETKKKIVKEYSIFYDKEDLKKVLKKSVVLTNDYGDHLTPVEKYNALRHACDMVNLYNREVEGIDFVTDEMNSIVGESNWWWEKQSRYTGKVLPETDFFDKDEN